MLNSSRSYRCQPYFEPFDEPTCACCAGHWSRSGTTIGFGGLGIGGLRYRICADCLEQPGKISRFIRQRKRRTDRPKTLKDMVTELWAENAKGPTLP